MTLMSDGLSALHPLMNTHASVEITYARDGSSVTLNAVPGMLVNEQRGGQVVVDVTRREWFILTADLLIDNDEILPERDDSITFVVGDRTETYAVFGDVESPHWEYTDGGHEQIVVRSILRSVA